ncbi:MAG: hypothetical protein ACYCYF_03335 [Anaerolineae bacterium]
MSIKDGLSAEQWKVVFNAPSAAAMFVSTASGGAFEMIKEILNASSFMQELIKREGGSGYGELVDDLLATIKGMSTDEVKANAIRFEAKDPVAARAEVKQVVADGVAAVAAMPGAEGYKRWLLDVAREVAETKTGGFLGIGSKSVIDEQEQAALDELKAMMAL